jgi:hypothetical protein
MVEALFVETWNRAIPGAFVPHGKPLIPKIQQSDAPVKENIFYSVLPLSYNV